MPRKPAAPKTTKKPAASDTPAFIAATVRPGDEHNQYREQQNALALVGRYGGDVKVLASRNGAGVASVPLRVMRRKSSGKSAFGTSGVSRRRREWMATGAGVYARKAMADNEDDVEEITDPTHPLVQILNEVNVRDDSYGLIEGTEIALGLTGNAYWQLAYQNGAPWPTEIWPLKPQYVRAIPSRTDFIAGYTYGAGYEIERPFAAEDIVHFRRPSPRNDYYGEGDLQAVLIHADISFDLACFWKATLDNACQPGLVITGAGVNAKTREELQEAVDRRYRGVKKAAVTAILSGDLKIEQWSLKEADFSHITGSDQVTKFMCRSFDMPVELLEMRPGGISDGGNVAERQWQKTALKPRCRRMENTLNAKLVPIFRAALRDETLFLCFDNPVDVDETAQTDRAIKLFAGNLFTRDQALAVLGEDQADGSDVYAMDLTTNGAIAQAMALQPPTPAGEVEDGDEVEKPDADAVAPVQAAPAGTDVQATALNGAQVAALQEVVRAAAAREIPLESVKPTLLMSFPNVPPALIDAVVASLQGFEPPKPEPVQIPGAPGSSPGGGGGDDPKPESGPPDAAEKAIVAAPPAPVLSYAWATDHCCKAAIAPPVTRFAADLAGWFEEVGPKFTAVTNLATVEEMQAAADAVMRNDPDALGRLVSLVKPYTEQAYIAGNNGAIPQLEAIDKLGGADRIGDVLPQRAINFLDTYNVRLADSVIATVRARVRATIEQEVAAATQASLTEGETIIQATARIKDIMGPESRNYMAERIARTETSRAVSNGMHQAAIDSGENVGVEWVSSGDPCEICQGYVGMITRPGEPFGYNDYGPIMGADAHPNDSCSTTLVSLDREEA